MSRLQFERKKKKKLYVIPLIIIVLLYVTIPVVLINKGSKLLEKAKTKLEQPDVYSPTVEFYNGLAFLSTAASFPGFSFWANSIVEPTTNEIIKTQDSKLKCLMVNILPEKFINLDNSKITKSTENNLTIIKIEDQDSLPKSVVLGDSLLHEIDSVYIRGWNKFFEKTNADKSKLHSFCKK